jgi:cell wall-associated NlpC family hydrolase
VSLRRLKPGDLVFYGGSGYYNHVAIYAGHGRVIHAPHSGEVVSYAKLQGAATARRLIGS